MGPFISRLATMALLALAISPVAAQDALQSYIVVLRPGTAKVPEVAAEVARAYGGQPGFVYQHALRGFSIKASPQAAAAIASSPLVAYVEKDMLHSIDVQAMPTGIARIFADQNTNLEIDGTDDYRVDVDVAVIDTGIDWQHPDLNVVDGINCAAGSLFRVVCTGDGDDDHYHGTHVAGTIGALDNGLGVVGVAPGARLWAVKVLHSKGSG
jgi:subtilisin family serine protease